MNCRLLGLLHEGIDIVLTVIRDVRSRYGGELALLPRDPVGPGEPAARITDHPILSFARGRPVSFTFEGITMQGFENEPISAALHANGIRILRHSPGLGRARGFFCAIGNCSSCLMVVDDRPNVRVCVEKLREGMMVERQIGKGRLAVTSGEPGL